MAITVYVPDVIEELGDMFKIKNAWSDANTKFSRARDLIADLSIELGKERGPQQTGNTKLIHSQRARQQKQLSFQVPARVIIHFELQHRIKH